MKNKRPSYTTAQQMIDELYEVEWGYDEQPEVTVFNRLLAAGCLSGPPFFLGPDGPANRAALSEFEQVRIQRWFWDNGSSALQWSEAIQPSDMPKALELWLKYEKARRERAAKSCGWDFIPINKRNGLTQHVEYVIENVLVVGQPGVIGGRQKDLKTTIAADLALSVAYKKPFLGKFRVVRPCKVGFCSGESGSSVMADTFRRIARSKGIPLDCPHRGRILFSDRLPKLDNPDHLLALEHLITEHELQLLILDPLYLCLNVGMASTNLFSMGQHLTKLTELGQDTGCTIIVCHHFNERTYGRPTLEQLAMVGVQQWARQWLLLSRRKRYDAGKQPGHHELWLEIAGLAGHSSSWALDVDEGSPSDPGRGPEIVFQIDPWKDISRPPVPPGRRWEVKLRPASEIKTSKGSKAKKSKNGAPSVTELKRVVEILKENPDGETKSRLRDESGLKTTQMNAVLKKLLKDKTIVECKIKRANNQTYDGYRLAKPKAHTREKPDSE